MQLRQMQQLLRGWVQTGSERGARQRGERQLWLRWSRLTSPGELGLARVVAPGAG